jgi:hypothetical protein
MQKYNCTIPVTGGPMCGESLAVKDGRIPNHLPLFFEGKFYSYNLVIESTEDWTNIYYQYSNEVLGINVDKRNQL